MTKSKLALIQEEKVLSARELKQLELEKQWSPYSHSIVENEQIDRTEQLIQKHFSPTGKLIADLGCGRGELVRKMRDDGATVHAVDLSRLALKQLEGEEGIETYNDYIPKTTLEDDAYDLVICTDVIGDLKETEYRLLMYELSRVVKKDGYVVCSTPLDLDSDESFPMFEHLAQTEFEVIEWVYSHHRLFLKFPFLKGSKQWLKIAESLTKNFYDEKGVSHALFFGKRKAISLI